MNAIEFKANIDQWGRIQLPEKYKYFSEKQVKVIVLYDDETDLKSTVAKQYEEVKEVIRHIQD